MFSRRKGRPTGASGCCISPGRARNCASVSWRRKCHAFAVRLPRLPAMDILRCGKFSIIWSVPKTAKALKTGSMVRADSERKPVTEARHILVVDDDRRIRDLIKSYLIENDFLVSVAGAGAEARE